MSMNLKTLASISNLHLAWRRLNTGGNIQYKKYFRPLYYIYELGIEKNLEDLRKRIIGGSYQPLEPVRLFLPKPSGLHRPITLLHLEDQIVLQSIANLFIKKLKKRRMAVQSKVVFSNIHQKEDTIFLLEDWRTSHASFTKQASEFAKKGYGWFANFDLAAFYDTISHALLIRTLFPKKNKGELIEFIEKFLKKMSSENQALSIGHGIPQGPIASDVLAEFFLLKLDEKFYKKSKIIRYVDDFQVFGKSLAEVLQSVSYLDITCRNMGLIPQSSKYTTRKNTNFEEENIQFEHARYNVDEAGEIFLILEKKNSEELFQKCVDIKNDVIINKSLFRYVLYHSEPSMFILNAVLGLMTKYPEHIDPIISYLDNFPKNKKVVSYVIKELSNSPFDYVRGEALHFLARRLDELFPQIQRAFAQRCVDILKDNKIGFSQKWGAAHYICELDKMKNSKMSIFIRNERALVQAFVASIIPDQFFLSNHSLLHQYFIRTAFEPSMMLAESLLQRSLNHKDFSIKTSSLRSQTRNIFEAIGIIPSSKKVVDPMGEILYRRYGIKKWNKWKFLFEAEYWHANGILAQGDPLFDSGRDRWLQLQNSFNNALFLAIQKHLHKKQMKGTIKQTGKKGGRISYGSMLDPNNAFSRNHINIALGLRKTNSRRNTLPGSHPYELTGGVRTKRLGKKEQAKLKELLTKCYRDVVVLFDAVL